MSRRIGAIRALVFGAAVACMMTPAAPAHAAYADPLVEVSSARMSLTWKATPAAAIDALDRALPNVGVASVLDSANHAMGPCNAEELAALPISPSATVKWCFDEGDATTLAWHPQGITSSGDADDDGSWGAKRAILSGWVFNEEGNPDRYNDARVAFIDYTNPAAPAYRWVYLVQPNATGSDFAAAKTHIGGMIWYGDKLIVNAVGNGKVALRVFSMNHILQTTSAAADIGKVANGWAAYGYQYVMPQIGEYTYEANCSMNSDRDIPCFSSISLDRSTSPDSLVAAEYFSDQTKRGRLIRYSFGADYRLPNTAAPAGKVYASAVGNQQGVLSYGGRWYLAHSSATQHGQLWRFTADGSRGTVIPCGSASTCWSLHPEALTYWPETGVVWSVTEWSRNEPTGPGGRVLFGLPLSAMP